MNVTVIITVVIAFIFTIIICNTTTTTRGGGTHQDVSIQRREPCKQAPQKGALVGRSRQHRAAIDAPAR